MAAIDTTAIKDISTGITTVINSYLVPLVFTIAIAIFLFGVAKAYILSPGNETERAKGHTLILWGIIGFAVMLSVWGLVSIVTTVFGLDKASTTSPKPPIINTTSS